MSSGIEEDISLAVRLPKAELHAHLHGSIRPATLRELLLARDPARTIPPVLLSADVGAERSLEACFSIFALIHEAVRDADAVLRITAEAIADFAADGVLYLEMRTTPRALVATVALGAWAEPLLAISADLGYYCAVALLGYAIAAHSGGGRVIARLLLSINRTEALEKAELTVALAIACSSITVPLEAVLAAMQRSAASAAAACAAAAASAAPATDAESSLQTSPPRASFGPFVVGCDLSGNPTLGDARVFLPALQRARDAGLRVAIHCGEVLDEVETAAILAWRPDRLGHMIALSESTLASLTAAAAASGEGSRAGAGAGAVPADPAAGDPVIPAIPIEICPTSNCVTLGLRSAELAAHPTLTRLLSCGYPLAICTDDAGVFATTLSAEYAAVARHCELSRAQLASSAAAAFRHAFLRGDAERATLFAAADAAIARCLSAALA